MMLRWCTCINNLWLITYLRRLTWVQNIYRFVLFLPIMIWWILLTIKTTTCPEGHGDSFCAKPVAPPQCSLHIHSWRSIDTGCLLTWRPLLITILQAWSFHCPYPTTARPPLTLLASMKPSVSTTPCWHQSLHWKCPLLTWRCN